MNAIESRGWSLRSPPVSAVPSIIFRVGFWGSAALKAVGDPDIYIRAAAASSFAGPTVWLSRSAMARKRGM
jgi:hypothetical protein